MKNLSNKEKKDLDHYVFQTLGQEKRNLFRIFLQFLLFKIKKIFA